MPGVGRVSLREQLVSLVVSNRVSGHLNGALEVMSEDVSSVVWVVGLENFHAFLVQLSLLLFF